MSVERTFIELGVVSLYCTALLLLLLLLLIGTSVLPRAAPTASRIERAAAWGARIGAMVVEGA